MCWMPERDVRKRKLFLSFFHSLAFSDLRRESVMRQSIQEVQRKGDARCTGQKVTDRIDELDAVDPEEPRQDENAGDEVDALSEAG